MGKRLAMQHIDLQMTMFDNVKQMRSYLAERLLNARSILRRPNTSYDLRRHALNDIETYLRYARLLRIFKIK